MKTHTHAMSWIWLSDPHLLCSKMPTVLSSSEVLLLLEFKSRGARQVELRKKKKLGGKEKYMANFHRTLPSQHFSFSQFQNYPGSWLFLPRPGLSSLIQPGPLCAQGALQMILTHTKA